MYAIHVHIHARTCTCTCSSYIKNVSVSLALVWVLELCVADEDGVHVAASVLVELLVTGDHDDSYLHITEDAQLIGFLEETSFTLAEGDLKEGTVSVA